MSSTSVEISHLPVSITTRVASELAQPIDYVFMADSLQHLWVVEQIIELPHAIAFLLKAIILKNYDPCTLFLV